MADTAQTMTPTTKEIIEIVQALHDTGMSYKKIAEHLGGIHRATISQWVRPNSTIVRLSPVYLAPLRALYKKHVNKTT